MAEAVASAGRLAMDSSTSVSPGQVSRALTRASSIRSAGRGPEFAALRCAAPLGGFPWFRDCWSGVSDMGGSIWGHGEPAAGGIERLGVGSCAVAMLNHALVYEPLVIAEKR
jgi:hypothetical protein